MANILKVSIFILLLFSGIYLHAQKKWYKGNTHVHTINSDGALKTEEIINRYRENGFQFLFITDHNLITPCEEFSTPDLICYDGEEITFDRHFNGLGIEKYIKPESSEKSIESVLLQNGIVTLNHPIWTPTRVFSKEILGLQKLKLLEIYNGITESWGYHDNLMLWDSILTSGKLIFGIASDDAHYLENINKGWIMVYANKFERDTLMQAINDGNFYSSTGIEFTQIEVNSKEIDVSTTNATNIKFIGQEGNLLKNISAKSGTYSITGNEWYIRVEASNEDGKNAWTQPLVWNNNFGGEVVNDTTIFFGQTTGVLTLKNYIGEVVEWQKRFNNNEWVTIPSSNFTTYIEYPEAIGKWEYRAIVHRDAYATTFSKHALVNVINTNNKKTKDSTMVLGIFPNPTKGCFSLQFPCNLHNSAYSISNLRGDILQSGIIQLNSYNQINFDLTTQPKGIYIIKIKSNTIIKTEKIINL